MTPRAIAERKRNYEAALKSKCIDCSELTTRSRKSEYYMVHDELWCLANPADDGMLCIGCFEKRIGRRLNPSDFSDCPLNHSTHGKSERLLSRQQPQGDMIMAKKITGMFEFLETLEGVIASAPVSKREELTSVMEAYSNDFEQDFYWSISAQSPTLLSNLIHAIQNAAEPVVIDSKERPVARRLQN